MGAPAASAPGETCVAGGGGDSGDSLVVGGRVQDGLFTGAYVRLFTGECVRSGLFTGECVRSGNDRPADPARACRPHSPFEVRRHAQHQVRAARHHPFQNPVHPGGRSPAVRRGVVHRNHDRRAPTARAARPGQREHGERPGPQAVGVDNTGRRRAQRPPQPQHRGRVAGTRPVAELHRGKAHAGQRLNSEDGRRGRRAEHRHGHPAPRQARREHPDVRPGAAGGRSDHERDVAELRCPFPAHVLQYGRRA